MRSHHNATISSARLNPFRHAASMLAMVLLTLAPWPANARDNENRPGYDYTQFPARSEFLCFNTCAGESLCKAYTFVKPVFQGQNGHCWLKRAMPRAVSDTCCASGPHAGGPGPMMKAENKTNRGGGDFRNFTANSWDQCESACLTN